MEKTKCLVLSKGDLSKGDLSKGDFGDLRKITDRGN